MKTARAFNLPGKSPSYIPTVALDAQGWPTADFDVMVFTAQDPKYVSGPYKLSFNGTVTTVKANGKAVTCSKSITNTLTLGVLSDFVTCDVVVSAGQLVLSFGGTASGARNVSLLRPSSDGGIFNRTFTRHLAPFTTLRAMDALHTNNSTIVEWADRCTREKPSCAGKDMPWEDLIDLVNEAKLDLWFNIPHMASDAYVAALADLLRARLDKNRAVYIEISNEGWNGLFAQSKWITDKAKAEVAAGENTLNMGGTDTNSFYWGWRWPAKRLMQVKPVFEAALGKNRVKAVLSHQYGNSDTFNQALKYLNKYYPPVSSAIAGIAIAPYFSTKERDNPAQTAETLMAGMNSSVDSNIAKWKLPAWDGKATAVNTNAIQYAKYYGVPVFMYEGGPDSHGAIGFPEPKTTVNRSKEMGDAVRRYLVGWYCSGGGLANYFAHSGSQTQYGSWGASESVEEPDSEKYKALIDIGAGRFACP